MEWASATGFTEVVVLASVDASYRHDVQLIGCVQTLFITIFINIIFINIISYIIFIIIIIIF